MNPTSRRSAFVTLAMSTLVCLTIGEVAVRSLLPRPGFTPFPTADSGVLVGDSVRGYTYRANLHRRIVTPNYSYDFATNDLGMRDSAIGNSAADPRILAVGDSFTQGLGVEAGEAWPKLVQRAISGSRTYNTGVSGYSFHQMRVTAELFVPAVRPNIILAGLYGHGNYRMEDPYVVLAGGSSPISRHAISRVKVVDGGMLNPAFERSPLRELGFWLDTHWYLAGHLLHVCGEVLHRSAAKGNQNGQPRPLAEAMRPLLEEWLRLGEYARSQQIPLVALFINFQEADGSFANEQQSINAILRQFGAANNLCFVDPLPALLQHAAGRPVFRLRNDRHWTPAAHALAASVLLDSLRTPSASCAGAANALFATRPRAKKSTSQ